MRPSGIQRIGTRFINRMLFPAEGCRLNDYLEQDDNLVGAPPAWLTEGVVSAGFFHQNAYTVIIQETTYTVNLIRTIQPAESTPTKVPIIMDINVSTSTAMELDGAVLRQRLTEMRWLKNKFFFGNITEKAKGIFQ